MVFAIALMACGVLPGTIKGSGDTVTETMQISGFTRVDAGNSFKVTITQAPEHSVAVRIDDNLVQYLDVGKSGETLVIRLRSGKFVHGATLEAIVSLPKLDGVKFSGASKGILNGINSQGGFAAELSGASNLSGDVRAQRTDVELSGASSMYLKGSGTTLTVRGSGASSADLYDFAVDSAVVDLSGASTAGLNAKDAIGPVYLSGASRLIYSGDPAFRDFRTTGASNISARD